MSISDAGQKWTLMLVVSSSKQSYVVPFKHCAAAMLMVCSGPTGVCVCALEGRAESPSPVHSESEVAVLIGLDTFVDYSD